MREKDNVFGSGSRAPVAITILVKNPNSRHGGCRIRYRDIGDYLSREEKLEALTEAGAISGIQSIGRRLSHRISITIGLDSAAMGFPTFISDGIERRRRQAVLNDAIFRSVFARIGDR